MPPVPRSRPRAPALLLPLHLWLQLADFGFSKDPKQQSEAKTRVGTPAYLAPEVIAAQPGRSYNAEVRLGGCVRGRRGANSGSRGSVAPTGPLAFAAGRLSHTRHGLCHRLRPFMRTVEARTCHSRAWPAAGVGPACDSSALRCADPRCRPPAALPPCSVSTSGRAACCCM